MITFLPRQYANMFVRKFLSPVFDSAVPVGVMWVLVFLFMGIEETLAENVKELDFAEKPAHHVWLSLRSFALPNYWVWYDKEAVHAAIEAQGIDLTPFILTTAFNAAMFTPALFATTMGTLLHLVIRRVPSERHWINAAIVWLPALTFLFDLAEDFAMLVIALGYPYFQYPRLMQALTWLSFLKCLGWVGCALLGGGILLTWRRVLPVVAVRR